MKHSYRRPVCITAAC